MAPIHYIPRMAAAAGVVSEVFTPRTKQVLITEELGTACSGFNCYDDGTKLGIIVTIVTVLVTIGLIIWYIGKESNRGQNTLEAWRSSFLYPSQSGSTESSTSKSRTQIPFRVRLTQMIREMSARKGQSRRRWYEDLDPEARVVREEPDSSLPPPAAVAQPQPAFPSPGIAPQYPGAAMPPGQGWPYGSGLPPAPGGPPGPGMPYPPFMPAMPAAGQPFPQAVYYAPQPMSYQQHLHVPDPMPQGQAPPQLPQMAPHARESQDPASPDDGERAASSSNRGPSGGARGPFGRLSWFGRLFRLPSPGHCSTIADPDSPSTPPSGQSSGGEGPGNISPSEVEWAVRRARIQEQESGEDPEQTSTEMITRSRAGSLVVARQAHRPRSQSRTRRGTTRESRRDRRPRTYSDDEANDSDGTVRRSRAASRHTSRRRPARSTSQTNSRREVQESEVEEYIIHTTSPSNSPPNIPLRSPSPPRPNVFESPPLSFSPDTWSAEGTVGSGTRVDGEQDARALAHRHVVGCGCYCHRRDSLGQL